MDLRQFMELFKDDQKVALEEDLCIVNLFCNEKRSLALQPFRLDANMIIFCIKGRVRLSINMKEFTMDEDQIAMLVPGYICQVISEEKKEREEMHFVLVGMSRRYLSTLRLDYTRIFTEGADMNGLPCFKLKAEEKAIAARYLELASIILRTEIPSKRESISSLISSFFFLSEYVINDRLSKKNDIVTERSSRADDIFNRFLRLLADHHMKERSVSFYAGKICLSPKYFSKLIKTASGRSAPEWIDSYVILEAQNFLKYSDMSIKEIVYRLNFSDQPTFTKFFKAHTGQTPAQFRKS